MKNKRQIKKKLLFMLPAAVFLVITLVFYGPLSLYLPNAEELWFSLADVMRCILPVSVMVLAVLLLLAAILPERISSILTKLVFGAALGFYLQGNLIGISYGSGVLDGTEIQWQHYTQYACINTLIWVCVLAAPFVLEKVLKNRKEMVRKGIIILSLFLSAVQIPAMVAELLTYHPYQQSLTITEEGMLELSSGNNVIMVILDTVDESYYREFVETHPEFTGHLEGFTHYENTLASGVRTIMALPSMLTGEVFRREGTYSEYLKNVYGKDNALKKIHESGVDVRAFSRPMYFSDEAMAYIENFSEDSIELKDIGILQKKIYKMTFSRYFPHLLKKYVWFDTAEFNEAKGGEKSFSQTNDARFIKEFRKKGFSFSDEDPGALRIYHLNGAHSPYVLKEDGTKGSDKTDVHQQTAGCFGLVVEMLDALKNAGVYQDTTIIITADHGDIGKAQQPFLLVKLAGAKGPYTTSAAPVSLFDMPGLLLDAFSLPEDLGEYGMRLADLTEDTVRERHVFINTSGSSRLQVVDYRTYGDAGDYEALEEADIFENTAGADTPYILGTTLYFDTEATGNIYCTEGFALNTGFRTVLRGPVSELRIPIEDVPDKGSLKVTITLHDKSNKEDTVILVNDTEVFHEVIDKNYEKRGITFSFPAKLVSEAGNILTMKFLFPDIDEAQLEKPANNRSETISFITMCIER